MGQVCPPLNEDNAHTKLALSNKTFVAVAQLVYRTFTRLKTENDERINPLIQIGSKDDCCWALRIPDAVDDIVQHTFEHEIRVCDFTHDGRSDQHMCPQGTTKFYEALFPKQNVASASGGVAGQVPPGPALPEPLAVPDPAGPVNNSVEAYFAQETQDLMPRTEARQVMQNI